MNYQIIKTDVDYYNDTNILIVSVDNEILAENIAMLLTCLSKEIPPIDVKNEGRKLIFSISRKVKDGEKIMRNKVYRLSYL